jgi:hypothetical protein
MTVLFDLDYGLWLVTVKTCRVFLLLSLFALRPNMFVGLRGCSLFQDGRMVFSCYYDNTVSFMNKEGVELFHIDEERTGYRTYDTPALRQTGSRNLTGQKTLPTIWGTYMKLVTKYQISAINSI